MAGITASQTNKWNALWWIMASLLMAMTLGGYLYLHQHAPVIRNSAMLSGVLISFWLVLQTSTGQRGWRYWQEAVIETRKVVWPTKEETWQTTLAVLVMLVIMGLLLWTVDALLLKLMGFLTARAGA